MTERRTVHFKFAIFRSVAIFNSQTLLTPGKKLW